MEQGERIVPRYPRKIPDISTMALQASDVLVLTAGEALSQGHADRIREWMRGKLDALGIENRVIVLDRGMKLEALRPAPEIYDGLPPLGAKGPFIGYSANGRPWALEEAAIIRADGKERVWCALGFERYAGVMQPMAHTLVDDLAGFIVVSMQAIMPKRPREASHGEATDQAPADTVGPEQRGAPVSGDGARPAEEAAQSQDEGGARGAGGGSGEAGGEGGLKNEEETSKK